MSMQKKKRKYNVKNRKEKSEQTRLKILNEAQKLLSAKGLKKTTIELIAQKAGVATPTVYSIFGSKSEIINQLGQVFVFGEDYKSLVKKSISQKDARASLKMVPQITTMIFKMELKQMKYIWVDSSPEIEELKNKLEQQRFDRQKFIVERLEAQGHLSPSLSQAMGREILWALSGRELFKKLVHEKKWSEQKYISWLKETLTKVLVAPPK